MTQDQHGQVPGTGYVVRGEVAPEDDTPVEPDEQSAAMTRFQKVASALSGDRPDPSARDAAAAEQTDTMSPGVLAEDDEADRTGSAESGAVSSPDAADRGDPDDEDDTGPVGAVTRYSEADQARPDITEVQDPAMTQPGLPGASADAEAAAARVAGKYAGAPAEPELRPGEAGTSLGGFSDLAYESLLPDASEYRQRWQQVQFRFVDDPRGSVTEAADVIAQVAAKLEDAIAERQRSLRATWSEGASADTETMRATLLTYRAFLDQLTGSGS
jgi:hypothetical protein